MQRPPLLKQLAEIPQVQPSAALQARWLCLHSIPVCHVIVKGINALPERQSHLLLNTGLFGGFKPNLCRLGSSSQGGWGNPPPLLPLFLRSSEGENSLERPKTFPHPPPFYTPFPALVFTSGFNPRHDQANIQKLPLRAALSWGWGGANAIKAAPLGAGHRWVSSVAAAASPAPPGPWFQTASGWAAAACFSFSCRSTRSPAPRASAWATSASFFGLVAPPSAWRWGGNGVEKLEKGRWGGGEALPKEGMKCPAGGRWDTPSAVIFFVGPFHTMTVPSGSTVSA